MKYLLITFLLLMVSCDMGARYEGLPELRLNVDTIPANLKDVQLFTWWDGRRLDSAHSFLTDGIYYDVMITSSKRGTVAYKKRDSAWVILDSSETLKMLLWQMELQAKIYR